MDPQTTHQAKPINLIRGPRRMDTPKLEALRDAWFMAPDLAAQQQLAREIQLQTFQDLPYIPAGQFFQATAYNTRVRDVVPGYSVFWNLQKDA